MQKFAMLCIGSIYLVARFASRHLSSSFASLQPFTVSVQQAFNTPTDAELSHHDSSDSESLDVRRGILGLGIAAHALLAAGWP